MNKLVDLDIAERDLKDATDRFEALQAHVFKTSNEIALVEHVQKNLEENISILKARHIITVAVEYKRAKDDLAKLHNNLTMLKLNRNSLEHSSEQARKFMEDCREKYLHAISNQGSRVIEVDFRSKHDRQSGDPT